MITESWRYIRVHVILVVCFVARVNPTFVVSLSLCMNVRECCWGGQVDDGKGIAGVLSVCNVSKAVAAKVVNLSLIHI